MKRTVIFWGKHFESEMRLKKPDIYALFMWRG